MSKPEPTARTYAQRYCAHYGIPLERFTDHLLKRSLHAPLRWGWPVLAPFLKSHFAIDRQCVQIIGGFHSKRQLSEELIEFSYHPTNRNFWRRVAGQRISTHRVRRALRSLPE